MTMHKRLVGCLGFNEATKVLQTLHAAVNAAHPDLAYNDCTKEVHRRLRLILDALEP